MAYTIEETGYSYSGISDIINNDGPEATGELINDWVAEFAKVVEQQVELEKELEQVKFQRSLLVSSCIYIHKALKMNATEPLVFISSQKCWIIKILDENRIDWECYSIINLISNQQ